MTHPTRRLLSSLFVITAIALTWHTVLRGALKEGGFDVYDLSGALVQHVAPDAAWADVAHVMGVTIDTTDRVRKHKK